MDLFKLVGKVVVKNSEANEEIDKTTEKAEKSESRLSNAFNKMGKFAVKAGKTIAVGIGTGMVALAGLGKKSIEYYSNYEQLVGGVETLFGKSSDKLIEYANNAYKTAGLSANDYMETVTSFSASLLQSLDGDTAKATEKANMAVIDMADNANKMGTAIGDIQNAYQGFAKQNYTMLDNLKLGYGGTKEEMERLLRDAEKISGIKYDISSYSDVVDAIHVMQESMGIAGTTAKEASSTIQGSIGRMKGAWVNFLTGMADPKQDFDKLVDNLVDSVITVADNLIPRIGTMLPRLVQGLSQILTTLASYLPELINQLLPALLEGATTLIQSVINVLPELFTQLITVLPQLLDAVMQIFVALIEALPELIQLIVDALPQLIEIIINAIISSLPQIISGLVLLFIGIVQALPQIISALINAIPQIISALMNAFSPFDGKLANFFKKALNRVKEIFVEIWNSIKDVTLSVFTGIANVISTVWGAIKNSISTVVNGISSTISNVFNTVKSTVTTIWNGIKTAIWTPIQWAYNKVSNIVSGIKNLFNFKFRWPHIPLPHFSISGSANPLKWLTQGVPKLSVDWYAKAMDGGMIMNKPTIFGYDQATQKFMAGGEAGSETVVGTNSLMSMIQNAVHCENNTLVEVLKQILELLKQYVPDIANGLDFDLILDTGEWVGSTAPAMDEALGRLARKKYR